MATAKQIEANRKNALKSTGPRTEQGKARSRLNALKHGRTARTVLPPPLPEGLEPLEQRIRDWSDSVRPRNGIERFLIEHAARLSWEIDRDGLAENTANPLLVLNNDGDQGGRQARARELLRTLAGLVRFRKAFAGETSGTPEASGVEASAKASPPPCSGTAPAPRIPLPVVHIDLTRPEPALAPSPAQAMIPVELDPIEEPACARRPITLRGERAARSADAPRPFPTRKKPRRDAGPSFTTPRDPLDDASRNPLRPVLERNRGPQADRLGWPSAPSQPGTKRRGTAAEGPMPGR